MKIIWLEIVCILATGPIATNKEIWVFGGVEERSLTSAWDVITIAKSHPPLSPTSVSICSAQLFAVYFDWVSQIGPYTLFIMNLSAPAFDVMALLGPSEAGYQDGPASIASFNGPVGLSIAPDCSWVAVADTANNMIRRVQISSGSVSTIAGQTTAGHKDDVGTLAQFYYPLAVAFSPDGKTVFVAEPLTNVIRSVDVSSAKVTTVAGMVSGSYPNYGYGFQDGTALSSSFNSPQVFTSSRSVVLRMPCTHIL